MKRTAQLLEEQAVETARWKETDETKKSIALPKQVVRSGGLDRRFCTLEPSGLLQLLGGDS